MNRFDITTQVEVCATVQPAFDRLIALGLSVTEDDFACVPVEINAMHVPRPELAVEERAFAGRCVRTVERKDANIATRPRYPRHVIQTDIGIRFLCETLDYQ